MNCFEAKKIGPISVVTVDSGSIDELKFGLSEKHTKFGKIFLMAWMFSK